MHQCLGRLLAQSDDEESLEALCRLLSTIGKELEAPPQQTGQGRPAPNVVSGFNDLYSDEISNTNEFPL